MTDVLAINDLEIWTRIGVPKEERAAEQRLLLTVEMMLDTRAAAKSDDLKKTVNYFDVCEDIKKLATKERKTIERFAEDTAKMILKNHKPEGVTVTVKKFAIQGSAWVSVYIKRP